jgi:glycine/D-amino acid oxidase-like deaminating enzyme
MTARAFALWSEHEKKWQRQFLFRKGVLWMAATGEDSFERGSVELLRTTGIQYEELTAGEMQKRWPQINFEGVHWGIYEPNSGYLMARSSCHAVVEAFRAAGGEYRNAAVLQRELELGNWGHLDLSDGSRLSADRYVFACGPWLGELFPQTIGDLVRATRQEMFFFGPPAGDARFDDERLPVWAEHRDRFHYGIPANHGRGFKIADDTRGSDFDPTSGDRNVTTTGLKAIREYLALRFPDMEDAPLVESRVCQYEQTPDAHFIMDRHPRSPNVWLLGGGSGHGFKHGPVVGEMMVELLGKDETPRPYFRLDRFRKQSND